MSPEEAPTPSEEKARREENRAIRLVQFLRRQLDQGTESFEDQWEEEDTEAGPPADSGEKP